MHRTAAPRVGAAHLQRHFSVRRFSDLLRFAAGGISDRGQEISRHVGFHLWCVFGIGVEVLVSDRFKIA